MKATIRRRLLVYAVLPLAYVITGRLGLLLAVPPGYATAVFAPAGIAVGAMLMAGPSTLPGIFIGSLLLCLDRLLDRGASDAGERCGGSYHRARFHNPSGAWRRRTAPRDRLSRPIG